MNRALTCTKNILTGAIGVTATLFTPSHCWAGGNAVLPWDYTLTAIQDFVADPFAASVLLISAVVAILAFALAGDSELGRRFAKTVVGTSVALIAVQLLNYFVP
jgi:type IV secretory pathway VirB2 component (pilin)